jgi:hypothetical protein
LEALKKQGLEIAIRKNATGQYPVSAYLQPTNGTPAWAAAVNRFDNGEYHRIEGNAWTAFDAVRALLRQISSKQIVLGMRACPAATFKAPRFNVLA